jgi:hypothetical protein
MAGPVRKKIEEAATELERIEARLAALQASARSSKANVNDLRQAVKNLSWMLDEKATPEEKHRMLGLVVERAVVVEPRNGRRPGASYGNDVDIHWTKAFEHLEVAAERLANPTQVFAPSVVSD